ncbi:MAG: hypothetical protein ABJ308_18660 [Halieaceae bacterium]
MSQSYDIFFAAQLVEGFEEATVRDNLGKLFKANAETLDKLFSGKPQMIKRGVDKQAAIKYKAALQKAGAVALIRANTPAETPKPQPAAEDDLPSSAAISNAAAPKPTATPAPADEPAEEAPAPGSMAERIAALAAEPSSGTFDESLTLAPAGTEVLREDEREVFEELDIDTSAIHIDTEYSGEGIAPQEPAPPAPDTEHLSMGEVGEDIPHLEESVEALDPDTSHLSMGEVGEDIPHLEEVVEPVNPDISNLDLAPEGSDVLEEQYRKHEDAEAPNTDHISLEN